MFLLLIVGLFSLYGIDYLIFFFIIYDLYDQISLKKFSTILNKLV